MNIETALAEGRDAARRYAWRPAYELLKAADKAGPLDAEDLEALGEAAWWHGRSDECINARERAYKLYLDADRKDRAALVALLIVWENFSLRAPAVAQAWLKRAEQLLHDEPVSVAHGYLTRMQYLQAGHDNRERALELARETASIGLRVGDRDLVALGLQDQGRTLIAMGQVQEGMALLDEATMAAVSGELTPHITGAIYCNLIGTCEGLSDYRRAAEWTEAARRWCDRMAIAGFPGMCRVHRADVIRIRGAWQEAVIEARNAFEELKEFQVGYAAEAQYLIGETQLWRGELREAREAFELAHQLGREPNPGLALLHLAEGKTDAAVASIRRALSQEPERLDRTRLLDAQVAIAAAANNLATVESAAKELRETAEIYQTPALKAQALIAEGTLNTLAGNSDAAVRQLSQALTLWREVSAPYEEAKVRVALAHAYHRWGDADGALLEMRAARSSFARLGAVIDERRALRQLADWGDAGSRDQADTAERTFLFTDIVRSTALVEAIGDHAWTEILRWHDQTLRRLIAEHAGVEVKQVGDGFFASFEGASQALACAVGIQQTLAAHRREHGFAPQVRIGVHRSAAAKVGTDYAGKGVHEAARIAGVAEGNEILASWATAQACDYPTSQPRSLTVKGIAEPIQVVTVGWH